MSAELFARIRRGDEQALAQLIREYEPEIRRAARARLGPLLRPLMDSVDLVQSVYITLLVKMRDSNLVLASSGELVALGTGIIRLKVAQHARRLERRVALGAKHAEALTPAEASAQSLDHSPDPAAAAQFQDQLERILELLSPQERRLIELKLEGHSTAQAATLLGTAPNTLRVKLGRLRQKLNSQGVFDWL
jgi:RNA polymerase sigma factor (sigma-70 family)